MLREKPDALPERLFWIPSGIARRVKTKQEKGSARRLWNSCAMERTSFSFAPRGGCISSVMDISDAFRIGALFAGASATRRLYSWNCTIR